LAEKSLVAPIGWPFLWFAMVAGSMARVRLFVKKDNERCRKVVLHASCYAANVAAGKEAYCDARETT